MSSCPLDAIFRRFSLTTDSAFASARADGGNYLLARLEHPSAQGGDGGGGYGQPPGGYPGYPPQQGYPGAPQQQQPGFPQQPGYPQQQQPGYPQQQPGAYPGAPQQPAYPQQPGAYPGGPQQGGYDPNAYPQQPAYPQAPAQQPYDPYGGGPGGYGQQPMAPPQQGYGGAPAPGAPAYPSAAPAAPAAAPYEPPPAVPAILPSNALRGFVVSYQANPAGEFWELRGGRITVGRANSGEQVDIALADATISSRHAAFNVDVAAGAFNVEDRGSTNGTYVNEEHIGYNGRRDLRDGDKVRFGGYTTIVKILPRN